MSKNQNDMLLFNRPQWAITPDPPQSLAAQNLPYEDYGVLPNVAQNLQDYPFQNNPTPPSYFTTAQQSIADWFTTRVHLVPLGKVK